MTNKQMHAYAAKQGIELLFDKTWNMVKGIRADGSIAFDTVIYDAEERMMAGELL